MVSIRQCLDEGLAYVGLASNCSGAGLVCSNLGGQGLGNRSVGSHRKRRVPYVILSGASLVVTLCVPINILGNRHSLPVCSCAGCIYHARVWTRTVGVLQKELEDEGARLVGLLPLGEASSELHHPA